MCVSAFTSAFHGRWHLCSFTSIHFSLPVLMEVCISQSLKLTSSRHWSLERKQHVLTAAKPWCKLLAPSFILEIMMATCSDHRAPSQRNIDHQVVPWRMLTCSWLYVEVRNKLVSWAFEGCLLLQHKPNLTRSTQVMSGNNAVMLAQKVSFSQAGVLLNLRSNTTPQKTGIFNN